MTEPAAPRATYRLQFSKDFGFKDAAALAPYLAQIGVSHLYASPWLKARPGSAHGYDIIDHNAINPDLGSEADFKAMIAALRAEGLGQILDFVPNHMGVGGADNAWWLDVLEWGRDSPQAGWFDIDWSTDQGARDGKLLAPFLGDQYGAVLEAGDLQLRFDQEAGSFAVWAYGVHKLPIRPIDYPFILGVDHPALERLGDAFAHPPDHRPHHREHAAALKAELAALAAQDRKAADAIASAVDRLNGAPGKPESLRELDHLIQSQHWRAAFWRVAADDINYRRFFNINELAGLRMEEPGLFALSHRLALRLIKEGALDGLRIDHIDGLLDPKAYCQRLRDEAGRPFYLVVEKILARHEHLREEWPVDGTTGYEFANQVGGLFIDPAAEEGFSRIYRDFTGQDEPFSEMVRAAKLQIMETEMAGELGTLARGAARIARQNWRSADFTVNILQAGLKEIIAAFPVYRTYVDGDPPSEADRRDIDWAVAHARRRPGAPDGSMFDFLHALLTTDLVAAPRSFYSHHSVTRLAMMAQQYSGPVMAKGLEDTVFYRYNRFIGLNEVGGRPDQFGTGVVAFHHANADRAQRWPATMLATSTHDAKRGEDARARLAVLSEFPEEWEHAVNAWSRILRARRGEVDGGGPPDRNDEFLLYQLLIGAWPAEMTGVGAPDETALADFAARLEGAMIKSVREAKRHTNWAAPNESYEDAIRSFIHDALDISRSAAFMDSFLPLQAKVAELGVLNSLAQTLLKLTSPGVPDIYQGSELWDLNLVDPDNRRQVDYALRQNLLERVAAPGAPSLAALLADWRDGAVKLAVIRRVLLLRRARPALFARGSYEPLEATGPLADHLCVFARREGAEALIVAVPRLFGALGPSPDWSETTLPLPAGLPAQWRDVLSDGEIQAEPDGSGAIIRPARLFAELPIALLIPSRET